MVQTTVCTGLFWWIYGRVVESRTGYDQARFYLLSAVLVSAVIPLLEIPVFPGKTVVAAAVPFGAVAEAVPVRTMAGLVVGAFAEHWAECLYVGIFLVFAFRILRQLHFLYRLVGRGRVCRENPEAKDDSVRIVRHPDIDVPFSFFHYIFLPEHISEEQKRTVLLHERSHMRHAHSVDRILLETLRGIMWYNPFVRLIGRKVVEIHEFQADRDVLDSGVELSAYRELLLQQTMGSGKHIVNNLHQSFIKKRFIMMTKFQKSKYALLRIGTVLPVTAVLMLCFSFVEKDAVVVSEPDGQAADTVVTTDKGVFKVKMITDAEGTKIYEMRRAIDNDVETAALEESPTATVQFVRRDTVCVAADSALTKEVHVTAVSSEKGVSVNNKVTFFVQYKKNEQVPGTDSTAVIVRMGAGTEEPLVVIDGKKSNSEIFAKLSPKDIESFSVLKDEAATRTYGEEGKNGVIVVRTKTAKQPSENMK